MAKRYLNLKDNKVYTVTKEPIKEYKGTGWVNIGYAEVLTSKDTKDCYLLNTLTKAPKLWKEL